jgi:hypothetical protein
MRCRRVGECRRPTSAYIGSSVGESVGADGLLEEEANRLHLDSQNLGHFPFRMKEI